MYHIWYIVLEELAVVLENMRKGDLQKRYFKFPIEKNIFSTGKIKKSNWIVFLCQLVKMVFNTDYWVFGMT